MQDNADIRNTMGNKGYMGVTWDIRNMGGYEGDTIYTWKNNIHIYVYEDIR